MNLVTKSLRQETDNRFVRNANCRFYEKYTPTMKKEKKREEEEEEEEEEGGGERR